MSKLDSNKVKLQHLLGILREVTSYLSQMLRIRDFSTGIKPSSAR